ncbi:putative anthocyanin 6''-O-malonyltransferase [Helianthus annuus]|nr:putative anthocyanin 6''-O-malonyltransferase [Helianthus annuus]
MSNHPKKMNVMDSLPSLTVIEQSQVSPPPATIGCKSLPLTFSDIVWLTFPDIVHTNFLYELPITKTQFTETVLPDLKQSLSITLQHFFPFVGKLTIYPTSTRKPEIRYVEGDSVAVTFAECNLDFNDLTGNHPRDCDKFNHLIPLLGHTKKVSDYITIPVFAVQVTLFPNCGICIGMTNHHCLGDATTTFCFLKAWTSIAQSGGSDENFLASGTLPIYDRLVNYPKLDEIYLKKAKVEAFNEEYKLPRLCGPTDKVRATFILSQTVINGLKKLVSTQLPTLAYVSSFTVACAYIWNCVASLHNDELVLFNFAIDCRSRMDPPIPAAYFGNCLRPCMNAARTSILKGKEGVLAAAEKIGDNLNKILNNKDGVMKDMMPMENMFADGRPTRMTGIAGTPKLRFYDLDFGFGKPRKHEMFSIVYNGSISISSCREAIEDLEIGVCLSATEMDVFIGSFNSGLESYI